MSNKISIEEIASKHGFIKGFSLYSNTKNIDAEFGEMFIEFGIQLLKLAAENAIAEEIGGIDIPKRLHVNKQSIYNTINQIE